MKVLFLIIFAILPLPSFAMFEVPVLYDSGCYEAPDKTFQKISIKAHREQVERRTIVYNSPSCADSAGAYIRIDTFSATDIQGDLMTLTWKKREMVRLSDRVLQNGEYGVLHIGDCSNRNIPAGYRFDVTCGRAEVAARETFQLYSNGIWFQRFGPPNGGFLHKIERAISSPARQRENLIKISTSP